jgi:hypothetical protein
MNQGFIRFIIVLIIFIIVLSLLGVNLSSVFQNPLVRENFSFLYDAGSFIWETYLKKPATFLWDIFITYLWSSFIDNMQRIKDGGSPEVVPSAA